jgi:hypothetical protein
MTAYSPTANDRNAFDDAMMAVRADHATLRTLALAVTRNPGFSTDDAMSLMSAMETHERSEGRMFALPFMDRPPESVTSTAARAQRRAAEFSSGTSRLPDPKAAAALFIDALLTHLAVEDAWLAHEREHLEERLVSAH